jgi:hypothetical protein
MAKVLLSVTTAILDLPSVGVETVAFVSGIRYDVVLAFPVTCIIRINNALAVRLCIRPSLLNLHVPHRSVDSEDCLPPHQERISFVAKLAESIGGWSSSQAPLVRDVALRAPLS